jgi:hypothetical protein
MLHADAQLNHTIFVWSSYNFCTRIYCIKVSLVKPTMKSGSRVLIQNLFCNFWTLLQVSMNFGILKQFLELKTIEKRFKNAA